MSDNLDEMLKEAPSLTFEPFTAAEPSAPEMPAVKEAETKVPEVVLTPEEQKMVNDFAAQIDITNTQLVMQYGAGSQKKIADFSENALNNVRTKDMGEIGQMLAGVVSELKDFNNEEEEKGFLGFFKKSSNKLENLKIKYDKAEGNINRICKVMEDHQITLLKDAAMLDKMYELNLNYFKELSMYILAGKQKLEQARTVELPKLLAKAEQSGLPEDTQAANDYASMCERFEKKIYDLELTRTISMQMAPQIRLIQSNDTAMSEKIQSTLVNTIPLWKSQMVIAIGLNHSTEAARAQKEVTDMTNALLKKNAETLKVATIETARESERGIVDIETLTATNKTLISTLDEVMKIQEDGRARRKSAEQELLRIEDEMRQKLLTVSRNSGKM
ncbi:toxic anion resistance protein [Acetatifactor muris]|uniref:TelA-like protein n=1 Tax=Acetatifactor muris TaxID=879566 RepID=A0A2K4ZHN9_9FIRM|nr:toxic anion resistance protein [Acetatifactor muris]MCI8801100.1 toxic anion resistance protein [Lachnospiraceae bacterium]MCR2048238.1 toxic anion resistance protein [Acetatifactor muris]SOY29998.1 TelA-like protein [Acetatifactor muris]